MMKRIVLRWNFFICSVYDFYVGVEESEESIDFVEENEYVEEKRIVGVFWDLDNKLFKGVLLYRVVISLRDLVSEFGFVVDMVVYVNYYVFMYVL